MKAVKFHRILSLVSFLAPFLASPLALMASNTAHAESAAHGITDGTQVKAFQTLLNPIPQTPFGLDQSALDELSAHVLWERLLLVKKGTSQISDPNFFLSTPNDAGHIDLTAELMVSLTALQAQDQTAMCRFPARMAFLADELTKKGVEVKFADEFCPKFKAWADSLDGQALSLIFAEEHPNSLGSSYGHAFLRMDTTKSLATGQDSDAIAINYSSVVPKGRTNEVARALKSVVGAYDGGLEIFNYQQKKQDYTIKGERDIWQYEMDLSTQEVRQILRHLWETKDVKRPYFFTHDNCATEIVRLIDVVKADKNIAHDMGRIVIPAKVANILQRHHMVRKTTFVPSNATLRQAFINNGQAFDLTQLQPNHNNPVNASPTHRLGVSMAYDDHHGNHSSGMVYGLSMRSAYQDLLDRPDGVRAYLDLTILSADVKYDQEKFKIDKATLFSSRSYNPSNSAKNNPNPTTGKPMSAWGLHLTAEQVTDASNKDNADHLVFNLRAEKGKSWLMGVLPTNTGDLSNTMCYVFGGAGGQLGKLNQGYRIGVGISAGCAYRVSDDFRVLGELNVPYWYHHDRAPNRSGYIQPSVMMSAQYDLTRRDAVRLLINSERLYDKTQNSVQLGYHRYF